MKRALNLTLGLAMALVLLGALGVQFISGAPPAPEQSATSAVLQSLGSTLVVTSAADSGTGTLRQALLDAQSGDTITFDATVFPPSAPVTIHLTSELPPVSEGNLRIEGNAGVILDGSNITAICKHGLVITSNGNTVRGLQVVNFSCGGISLTNGTQYNTIEGNVTNSNGWGIGLWGDGTSFNTVVGNMVGIDTGGAASGNEGSGVYIFESASYNTIGPGNVIAHNRAFGVEVWDSGSVGNTVTQNSIYDNDRRGIELRDGGNSELAAPCIVDFDLTAGTLTGSTCVNCTVEVFSDSNDEGKTYEGQATVDSLGAFTFNKDAPFTGPHLTSTTTDGDGNTSEFSEPTSGTSRTIVLQEGNNLPKTQLDTKRSEELADNRIGDGTGGLRGRPQGFEDRFVDNISKLGLKWTRLSLDHFDWSEVAKGAAGYSRYYIDPIHDQVITDLADSGVKMMYCLVFWDEEILPEEGYARFKTEEEIQRYLDYVQFIVHNFKDRIEYYELFNEPHFSEYGPFSQQNIEVTDYINLAKRAVPIIRQEYLEAKIVVGATGLDIDWRDYLFGILESDVMPLADAVSWHTGPSYGPGYDETREYYYEYPSIVQEIRDVASSHGFTGEYIAEEMGWWTPDDWDCDPCYPWRYAEILGAKYLARAVVMHLGVDIAVQVDRIRGHPSHERVARNLCTIMAGTEPVSLTLQVQSVATNTVSYGFALPNGDHLIGLWTDGVAVEDDPGIEGTLILNGFSDHKVMGIDLLNGIQQQMVTSNEDGNLVIRNLLVKDYPITLRLTKYNYVFLPIVLKGCAR